MSIFHAINNLRNYKPKKVSIYLPVPVCPNCSAKVLPNPSGTLFRCTDCNSTFVVLEQGQTEREFICVERYNV